VVVQISERTVKVSLIAQATGYISGMDAAAKKTREVGSEAEKLAQRADGFRALGTAGVAVGVAILGIGAAALKTGIAYNTLQQTSRAALKTLLGSAEAANVQMDKLDAFARNSPFAKQVFIKAQQQMLAFGVETKKVIPYLDAVQNAVAAAGGSNAEIAGIVATMSKIQSASKITGQDLIEFGNRGVNAAEIIGSQMGKTGAQIRGDITAGSLGATEALDALAAGMSEKFAGASDNVKQTFEGSMDRVKAAWRDFASELAKPLVDPNGGGALVDLLNWTADMMRGFIALPEPVKATISVLTGLIGVVALVAGTALLAIPKIAAFKIAMGTLNITGAAAGAKLGGLAQFLTGPWGIALAAAAVGVGLLSTYLDSLKASSVELTNSLKTARTQAELFEVLGKGREMTAWRDVTADLENMNEMLTKVKEQNDNLWSRFTTETHGFRNAIQDTGAELAGLAANDLPASQKAFRLLTEGQNLSAEQFATLIDTMPAYRDALIKQAGQLGINVTSTDEAANSAGLLKIAQGGSASVSLDAADAYLAAADEAAGLDGKLRSLIDTINEANGVGQDAVTANNNYQNALADVDEQIRKATEGLDENADGIADYINTLDGSTQAGRDNQDMLVDLAAKSQDAAKAQFDLDQDTANYKTTLEAGRQAVIDRAIALGATAEEAQNLADKIYAIPPEKQFNMIANLVPARQALDAFFNSYDGRTLSATMRIANGSGGGGMTFADGGAIGYAGGGQVRGFGGPRQDNIPIMASVGEHMLDVGDVKRMGGHAAVYRFRESLAAMQSAPYRPSAPAAVSGGDTARMSVGDSGPTDLSGSTIKELVRGISSAVRQDVRMGVI
jgi:tape measure domain-containing protein